MDAPEEPKQEPMDVLAAEEFPVGDRAEDSHATTAEPPHDVLAADEFAMPAADPALHHEHAHEDGHAHDHEHDHDHEHEGFEISLPALGGAVAGLVGGLWLLIRRRRRSGKDGE